MKIRDRIRELRRVPASDLLPNPKNWRTHPESQKNALRGVLSEVGMADACLARELPDGSLMLIDGHLRAETVADAKVPVLILDVTEAEADKILATLDPLAAMAEKDAEQLASLLSNLKEQNDNLAALVWPDYIIDPLLSADWTPPEPGEMPTKEQKSEQDVLYLTAEQRETIDAAIAKCREFNEDDSLTEAQCVELICVEYLSR
ncbi:MAG: hypothetical protein FJ284_07925 [Planctomycetes bacterium]|nr:hypothetical protein [Planctomycetota bacterium]